MKRTSSAVVVVVAAALCASAPAAAQEPVTSFDQLNTRLKVGDTVWVTDADGREIKGRIASFAPDAMGIDADGAQTLPADRVRLVRNRRSDSLSDGAWVGLGVGFGVGAGLTAAICSSDERSWSGGGMLTLLCAGAGAGVGVGVDAAIPGERQIVFRAPGVAGSGSARLSFAPVITPRRKGLAMSFAF